MDTALTFLNQTQVLNALEMFYTLAAFINSEMELPAGVRHIKDQIVDPEKVDPKQHRKTLTNALRQQVLRMQPYLTVATHPQLCYKTLDIL